MQSAALQPLIGNHAWLYARGEEFELRHNRGVHRWRTRFARHLVVAAVVQAAVEVVAIDLQVAVADQHPGSPVKPEVYWTKASSCRADAQMSREASGSGWPAASLASSGAGTGTTPAYEQP
jgi:hypothetical protein